MTREDLITDIRDRFRFSANDIRKGLADYELELIYKVYPRLEREYINSVIEDFISGKIKAISRKGNLVKTNRTTKHKGIKEASLHLCQ